MTKEFVQKFATIITAAFSLVAALAWNETVKSFINQYISAGSEFMSLLIYAIIVTILAVLVSIYINKFADKIIKREEKLAGKIDKLEKKLEKCE